MKLVYENERGKIVMGGGSSDGFNITQISGLSIPENDVNTVRYPNIAGQLVTQSTPMERIITISADVFDDNRRILQKAIKVLTLPGVMTISTSGKMKKINCRCISFEPNKRKGQFIPFTVQFCADYPYFEDLNETKTNISKREGMLKSPFVLECAFSERIRKNNVINHGDIKTEPVVFISSETDTSCPEGISVINHADGNVITLKTDISAGEVITVDIKSRKITSNKRGNIISCLAEESSLSRFLLDVGVSEIEVSAPGSDGNIRVVVAHCNNYVSMIV